MPVNCELVHTHSSTLITPACGARHREPAGRLIRAAQLCLPCMQALTFLGAALSMPYPARARKPTFGSQLVAFFQFLRIARRALLSLYGARDQNQSNGSR